MRKPLSIRTRYLVEGYSFITPWVIGFVLFMAVPLGMSLFYSFNEMIIMESGLRAEFVGFKHYLYSVTVDVDFLPRLVRTIVNILTQVPLIIIFSLSCALLLNQKLIGKMIFRAIFFLPVIVASGAVLQKLMEQDATTLPLFAGNDLMYTLMRYIPPEILFWIFELMNSITLVIWDSGVPILIFLAGLQTVPTSLYEAAQCDGATPWESFWKITFPMIKPMIFVNVLFSIVYTFTKINNSVMFHILSVMKRSNYGYSAALGWVYFFIIFIIIAFVFYIFRNNESAFEKKGV